MHRYAIYCAPRVGSDGWLAGSHWLGRCAAHGQPQIPMAVPGIDASRFHALTRAPRRYGWHATLKAPFALAPGVDEARLRKRLHVLAQSLRSFTMPRLKVAWLDDFLALVPDSDAAQNALQLGEVAGLCVKTLADLAAPLTPAEIERRRAAGLTPEEDALLLRWGYPFVFQRFRFHFSLTGALHGASKAEVQALMDAAHALFDPLPPGRFDTLSLFAEPEPGADFTLLEQVELQA